MAIIRKRKSASHKTHKRAAGKPAARRSGKKRALPAGLKKWNKALKALGYMTKGSHKKIPKKGTAGYRAVKAKMAKM